MKKLFELLAKKLLDLKKPADMDRIRQKQMLLHPASSPGEVTEQYYIKKLSLVFFFILAGAVLALLIWISDLRQVHFIEGNVIERNGSGGGEKTVLLDIFADDELYEKNKSITISERQYTKEEAEELLGEAREILCKRILGENLDPDHVDKDLDLVSSIEGYPFSIEWLISDYTVLDGNGRIREDLENENGIPVSLTAVMTYGELREEYLFSVNVFPKYTEEEEKLENDIDRKIKKYDELTLSCNRQLLPDEADGKKITYRTSTPKTALYVLVISVIAAAAIYFGKDSELDSLVKKREKEMLMDYPEIVSKLTLLIGAGLTVKAAFEKTAADHKKTHGEKLTFAYEEMMITVNRMKSGMSEYEAYLDFGKRCAVKRFVKLGALLSQNIKKGSRELLNEMEAEVKEAFEDRKAMARRIGEEAGTKLLGPMAMMLSVVMIIVIVPAFLSFRL